MEETPYDGSGTEDDEVFYIFYEDKKPAASYETPQYYSPPTQVIRKNGKHTTFWKLQLIINSINYISFDNDISE